MPEYVYAGATLAIIAAAIGLHWAWCRRAAGAARRDAERLERKLDALLRYLSLDEELAEIDAAVGGAQSRASTNSLSTEPPLAARVRSTLSRP